MRTETYITTVGDEKYEVDFQQFETLGEAFAVWEEKGNDPQDVALGLINSAQKQNALQGGKSGPREALEAHGPDSTEFADAVEAHRKTAAGYIVGAPRRSSGGPTKAQRTDLGTLIVEHTKEHGKPPTQSELEEMLEGITG